MKYNVAEIGKNRLQKVLTENNTFNAEVLCNVLKSEFLNIAKSYLDQVEIVCECEPSDDDICFFVSIACKRVKSFGYIS